MKLILLSNRGDGNVVSVCVLQQKKNRKKKGCIREMFIDINIMSHLLPLPLEWNLILYKNPRRRLLVCFLYCSLRFSFSNSIQKVNRNQSQNDHLQLETDQLLISQNFNAAKKQQTKPFILASDSRRHGTGMAPTTVVYDTAIVSPLTAEHQYRPKLWWNKNKFCVSSAENGNFGIIFRTVLILWVFFFLFFIKLSIFWANMLRISVQKKRFAYGKWNGQMFFSLDSTSPFVRKGNSILRCFLPKHNMYGIMYSRDYNEEKGSVIFLLFL